jgi:hypothetical protein
MAAREARVDLEPASIDGYPLQGGAARMLNRQELRIQKVDKVEPHAYTAVGWRVSNIAELVAALRNKGVVFERYPGLAQEDSGVWRSPSGAQVAWFKDPDGNTLSLTEM